MQLSPPPSLRQRQTENPKCHNATMPQCHIYMKMRLADQRASSLCKQREGSG